MGGFIKSKYNKCKPLRISLFPICNTPDQCTPAADMAFQFSSSRSKIQAFFDPTRYFLTAARIQRVSIESLETHSLSRLQLIFPISEQGRTDKLSSAWASQCRGSKYRGTIKSGLHSQTCRNSPHSRHQYVRCQFQG